MSFNTESVNVSLASVERQADGRLIWHVGLVNHVPGYAMHVNGGSKSYMLSGDRTKYDAQAIDDATVAPEERKGFDVIFTGEGVAPGLYRLFFVVESLGTANLAGCPNQAWSSTPVLVP